MKKLVTLLLMVGFIVSCSYVADAQINLGKKIKKAVNKKTDEKVDKAIEKKVDDAFDVNKDDKDAEKQPAEEQKLPDAELDKSEQKPSDQEGEKATSPTLYWAKYDFVPGDKVVFEDNLIGEENGEFPSRWDLQYGNVEIAQFGGENVIMFMSGSSCIIPYLKNPEQDYLPDIFTIEFDVYYDVEPHSAKYFVSLYDKKNQRGTGQSLKNIKLFPGGIQFDGSDNLVSGGDGLWYNRKKPFWRHISIGFNIRSLKVYYDDVRMLNIPHLGFNPTGLSVSIINTNPVNFYMKNIRIAEGGQKLYDKFLQDGKIVTNAIRFDVNKITIKPESMGAINLIYKILNDNPDLKFSVEGHTDSDGDEALNQTLSEGRAEAIMNKLIEMGISGDRLSFKGFGESKPIAENATAEGKANNRRVEFVKM